MSPQHYDPQEIKRRLAFIDLATHEGLEVRRAGGAGRTGSSLHVAVCPFHQEKSGSFTIYSYNDRAEDHAHCFGCGWNGDIIDFYRERHGGDFISALAPLASLASVSLSLFKADRERAAHRVPRMTGLTLEGKEKPPLPRLRALGDDEMVTLSTLRGLSKEGIRAAAAAKRVGFAEWPQWEDRNGCWRVADGAVGSWVVTDHSRRVAQFRRLDGAKFVRKDGHEIKAWTKGSPTWPVGAAEIGNCGCVIFVEGGADMLAAFHFLWLFHRLHAVAVVAMLGASCGICDEALAFFARKRVRLIMHADPAGIEASARWTNQLTAAGAAVESFSLEGLTRQKLKSGNAETLKEEVPVSDLNDLALCDESVWLDPELKAAFLDFDF